MRQPDRRGQRGAALALSLALAAGLLLASFLLADVARAAAGPDGLRAERPVIGLASAAVDCLAVNQEAGGPAAADLHLAWQGEAIRARLMLRVSGSEAAHTIRLNGQPAARAPARPEGAACHEGEVVYLDIAPGLLRQGANRIELTDDARPGDVWRAAEIRLEVTGRLSPGEPLANGPAATAAFSYTASFTNAYDGTSQEARVVVPGGYVPGTPAPLVVYVHGRSSDMYDGEEYYAGAIDARGWLLASPQLHGSWTTPPSPPGIYAYASLESQYDIVGAVGYMLANYAVQTDQIYLVGYSMGAQTALVTAGKFPDVFAAVFDNKGPTDMAVWHGESSGFHQDRMEEECHQAGAPKTPGQNPFCYERRSGLFFASNYLHTPLSITHSVSDTLVPFHHSPDMRDAVNGFGPDQPVEVYADTIAGPACGSPYHCFNPDPDAVLDFFAPHRLAATPAHLIISTDQSKSFHWLNIAQTGGDHWTRVEVSYDPAARLITASISDTLPLALGFNLGAAPITGLIPQPGLGLPPGWYQVTGGGSSGAVSYLSGYLTVTVTTAGQTTVTVAALPGIYLPFITRAP